MEQLINSGLSIKDSLEVTATIKSKKNDSCLIANQILDKIQKGISFADAIAEMPDIFPEIYRGIIKVGNKIGSVEKIFPRLRVYLETRKKIKEKISSALLYPSMVTFTAIAAFLALSLFVFPKLKMMFQEFGGEASITLQNNISKMQNTFLIISLFLFAFILFIILIKKLSKYNPQLRQKKDRFILLIPIVGKFISYFETLNFAFAMETLTSGGVTIEASIKESESVISNTSYKNALTDINQRIQKGESLSSAFSRHKEFPPYMIKWIHVGERSGKTEQIFSQIRYYFQNTIDQYTSKFMSLIEPALIIIIGIILLVLILTIIIPIFSLYGNLL